MFCCGNNDAAISTILPRNKEESDEISVDKPAPTHLKCVMVTGGGEKSIYA